MTCSETEGTETSPGTGKDTELMSLVRWSSPMHKSVCHTLLLPLGLIFSISCLPLFALKGETSCASLTVLSARVFTVVPENMSVECIFYLAPKITGVNKQHSGQAKSVLGNVDYSVITILLWVYPKHVLPHHLYK